MPIEITMPRLSDTMETGTVIKWNVKEGDAVSTGDVLADIETDKATMELESYDDGVVAKILIAEGQAVDVGAAIMVLAEEDEDVATAANSAAGASSTPTVQQSAASSSASDSTSSSATAIAEPPAAPPAGANGAAASNGADRVIASPLARKIAQEQGVDLATVHGTGPSGRITKRDVESAAPSAAAPQPAATHSSRVESLTTAIPAVSLEHKIIELSNMRRTIAKVLVESKQTVPHYQVTVSARMDALGSLRKQLNEQLSTQGVKLSVNDFLVRACALAMHEHPFINSRWIEHNDAPAIEILPDVNVGVAVALPTEKGGGLVVATLRHADHMGLRLISNQTKELAQKARTRGLSVEEMSDSTFTISNLGMFGVEHFTAIINPPNACILAVGAAMKKPVVEGDAIVVGSVMEMTISSDHRIVDGAMAAAYLNSVKDMLENPATLLV